MKFLAVCFLFLMSLHAFSQSTRQQNELNHIRSLVTEVKVLAQANLYCEQSSDCAVLAIGSRACGGPNDYVFTSIHNEGYEQLVTVAQDTQDKERAYNATYGIMSICSMKMPPQVNCEAGTCTLVGPQ